MLKLLYYAGVVLLVGYVLWRYWQPITAALRNFFRDLRALLDRLLGRRDETAVSAAEEAVEHRPPPPFSSFQDPFDSGAARRWPPDRLVQYCFSAFEAWSREQGVAREPDETPLEFARRVAVQVPAIGVEARALADIYGATAFSGGRMATSTTPLRRLWQQMQSRRPAAVG